MITILTGPVGGGKTTLLKAAIPAFRARGIRVGGYLSERVMDGSTVLGYDLRDLRTGGRHPFLRIAGHPGEETVGPFALDPAGLAAAIAIIEGADPEEIFILDELGRLELEGRGVWPAARHLLKKGRRDIVIVIRAALLEAYQALFRAECWPVSVVSLSQCPDPEAFVDEVLKKKISVRVRFFAYFRKAFDGKEKLLDLDAGTTVGGLLEILGDTPARRAELFADNKAGGAPMLKPDLVVMINGADLASRGGLAAELCEGDTVAVFPLIGGG